jgi:hypothetical protein
MLCTSHRLSLGLHAPQQPGDAVLSTCFACRHCSCQDAAVISKAESRQVSAFRGRHHVAGQAPTVYTKQHHSHYRMISCCMTSLTLPSSYMGSPPSDSMGCPNMHSFALVCHSNALMCECVFCNEPAGWYCGRPLYA